MQWGVPIALAVLAVSVRLILSVNRVTILGFVRAVTVGVFVGSVVNLYLGDIESMSDGTRGAIVGVAAVLAEDLTVALLALGKQVRERPTALLDILLRGRK
jgi:hypothetical protein